MKSIFKIFLIAVLLLTVTGSTLYIIDKSKVKLSKKKGTFLKKQNELDKFYSDKKLGAFVENGKTIFRIFTPTA
ncbi:MAG: pullulanase, partial [Ignavibacteriaceae bacterium]|nr:pullulanase [Ignavibacteriaceae bacterium]